MSAAAFAFAFAAALFQQEPAQPARSSPDEPLRVETGNASVAISPQGAAPVEWVVRVARSDGSTLARALVAAGDSAPWEVVFASGTSDAALRFTLAAEETPDATIVRCTSEPSAGGRVIEKTWTLPRRGFSARLDVSVHGTGDGEAFELAVQASGLFATKSSDDFAGDADRVRPVLVTEGEGWEPDFGAGAAHDLAPGEWAGLRNRFFAVLAAPSTSARAAIPQPYPGFPPVVQLEPGASHASFTLYAGPIERKALDAAAPELAGLLYTDLWPWMRWLCRGLESALAALVALLRVEGLAILALALVVKFVMAPLTAIADRWQRQVDATQARLAPVLADIKQTSRGAEQTRRMLALYRHEGVHPLYALKSLFGVAIQIPFFFAAYHVLHEDFDLLGTPFLWIDDLSLPDRIATLPFTLPWFGDGLNLMPFVMTVVTCAASWLHGTRPDGAASRESLARRRRNLYLMAAFFFVLLYTFPAGMVLYWTSNNLVQLGKELIARGRLSARAQRVGSGR